MKHRRSAPTLAKYAERWLKLCASLKPGTQEGYEQKLRKHILPTLGQRRLKDLTRGDVRSLLAEKLQAGLARDTVRLIHATLRAMLAAAVEDELLKANPASGVGRSLRLGASKIERSESIKAMTREQLEAFLEQALHVVPGFQILFWLMSRTGLRLSEALALKWQDVDVINRRLRVERALGRDLAVTTPKSGHGRSVDLSASAARELMAVGKLRCSMGYRTGPADWLFPGVDGGLLSHEAAQTAFRRARTAAGLQGFTPHSLRHTYASILLAEGVSPAYVQEQLGHSSIELTVGTYGRWLRKKAPGALDVLEGEVGLGPSGSDEGSGKRISAPPDGSLSLTDQATETKGLTACGAAESSKIENLADPRPQPTLLNVGVEPISGRKTAHR